MFSSSSPLKRYISRMITEPDTTTAPIVDLKSLEGFAVILSDLSRREVGFAHHLPNFSKLSKVQAHLDKAEILNKGAEAIFNQTENPLKEDAKLSVIRAFHVATDIDSRYLKYRDSLERLLS